MEEINKISDGQENRRSAVALLLPQIYARLCSSEVYRHKLHVPEIHGGYICIFKIQVIQGFLSSAVNP